MLTSLEPIFGPFLAWSRAFLKIVLLVSLRTAFGLFLIRVKNLRRAFVFQVAGVLGGGESRLLEIACLSHGVDLKCPVPFTSGVPTEWHFYIDTVARRGQRIGFMEDCFQNRVQGRLETGLGPHVRRGCRRLNGEGRP